VRLTASLLHARHGGTPRTPARAEATRAEPRGSPPHASLSRAAPSLSSRPCFLPNGVEVRRNSKSRLLYSGGFLLNCSVKPLRVLVSEFASQPFSFLFRRVWSLRSFHFSPSAFSIYAQVPGDIFQYCSKVHLSPCRSFLVRSMVQPGPCMLLELE